MRWRHWLKYCVMLCCCLFVATACSGVQQLSGVEKQQQTQELTFPLVGELSMEAVFRPWLVEDENDRIVTGMMYSGLVREGEDGKIVPEQANWQVSVNQKTYTLRLKQGLTFADGQAITASIYRDSWTRMLTADEVSATKKVLFLPIVGAHEVVRGEQQQLSGVKILDAYTLQIELVQPTPNFLYSLARPIFLPLAPKLIEQIGTPSSSVSLVGMRVESGPLVLKKWVQHVQMDFVPNVKYHGPKAALAKVTALFVNDAHVAFKKNRAGHYDFVWNITAEDQQAAKGLKGFQKQTLWQTQMLFFDVSKAPFQSIQLRQALSKAIDTQKLAKEVYYNTVTPTNAIVPANMPDSMQREQVNSFDAQEAKQLFTSAIQAEESAPELILAYPAPLVPYNEVRTLQRMWWQHAGIEVQLRAMETESYWQALAQRQIAFGVLPLSPESPSASAILKRFSTDSVYNVSQWQNTQYDTLLKQGETAPQEQQGTFYAQAEQLLLQEQVVVPLYHPTMAAVIPYWVQGVTLNSKGVFFGDWSKVRVLPH